MTGTPTPADRFRLRTFGTLTLTGAGEATVLGQHGHHRRRLALLAVLAAAGDRGWSRDQLLLFFWPDASQARARHSLDQLLYALRSSIGEELFVATNPVVLNPALVTSDVADFAQALDADQHDVAVKQYRGPFLDGFYLDDAPEFERWVEEERARLKSRYTTAVERLAEAADAARDHVAAVRWWRALVEAEPVSARSAAGFIRSLMKAGDHAAALQFAEQYESIVARELGTSVGPAVAKLVAEVRAAAGTERITSPRAPVESARAREAPVFVAPVAGTASPPVSRSRLSPARIGTLIAAAAAIGFVLIATKGERTPESARHSIAVLPLVNVSRDSADAVIVDGLSEELITALLRIEKLRVTARQSSFMFRESSLSARQIGDSLRVTNLLEGSVLRLGNRFRVHVRLVSVPNGATLWSTTYEPSLGDIFAMQSEIAAAVARELELEFSPAVAQTPRRGLTQNFAALELYLRGRDPIHMRTEAGLRLGLQLLEQAVALDSGFAAAYAAMPYLYFSMMGRVRNIQEATEIQERAETAARKAIALDPDLPQVYGALAVALVLRARDLAGAEAAVRKAISLGGAPRIRENLSRVLMWSGRHAESLEEARRAAEEDPLSATAAADVGEGLCVSRRVEEGLAQLARLATLPMPMPRVAGYKMVCYMMQEKWASAIEAAGPNPGTDPYSMLLGYAVARSGDTTRALAMEAEAIEYWRRTGLGAIRVVYIAAGHGDRDKAFQWLDRVSGDPTASPVMYPFFSDLHSDPRFARYRQRIGLK